MHWPWGVRVEYSKVYGTREEAEEASFEWLGIADELCLDRGLLAPSGARGPRSLGPRKARKAVAMARAHEAIMAERSATAAAAEPKPAAAAEPAAAAQPVAAAAAQPEPAASNLADDIVYVISPNLSGQPPLDVDRTTGDGARVESESRVRVVES